MLCFDGSTRSEMMIGMPILEQASRAVMFVVSVKLMITSGQVLFTASVIAFGRERIRASR
jgi:hypothetical protein